MHGSEECASLGGMGVCRVLRNVHLWEARQDINQLRLQLHHGNLSRLFYVDSVKSVIFLVIRRAFEVILN